MCNLKVYNEYWTRLTAWFWFLFRYLQEARHRCRHMPSWSLSKVVVDVSFSGTHVDVKGWIEVGGPKNMYGLFKRMYVDEQVQTRPYTHASYCERKKSNRFWRRLHGKIFDLYNRQQRTVQILLHSLRRNFFIVIHKVSGKPFLINCFIISIWHANYLVQPG